MIGTVEIVKEGMTNTDGTGHDYEKIIEFSAKIDECTSGKIKSVYGINSLSSIAITSLGPVVIDLDSNHLIRWRGKIYPIITYTNSSILRIIASQKDI